MAIHERKVGVPPGYHHHNEKMGVGIKVENEFKIRRLRCTVGLKHTFNIEGNSYLFFLHNYNSSPPRPSLIPLSFLPCTHPCSRRPESARASHTAGVCSAAVSGLAASSPSRHATSRKACARRGAVSVPACEPVTRGSASLKRSDKQAPWPNAAAQR